MILDFRHVFHMPAVYGAHMDPIWLGLDVGKILVLYPAEIGAPETPGVSHGTKIFGAKIFSYHPLMNLFYGFCGLVMLKKPKIKKNWSLLALSPITKELCSDKQFFAILRHFFAWPIHKTHKISSLEDDIRIFLRPNFWSHGTPLGSPGVPWGPISAGCKVRI